MNKELNELKEYLIKEQANLNDYDYRQIFRYTVYNEILGKIKEIETNRLTKSLIENGY